MGDVSVICPLFQVCCSLTIFDHIIDIFERIKTISVWNDKRDTQFSQFMPQQCLNNIPTLPHPFSSKGNHSLAGPVTLLEVTACIFCGHPQPHGGTQIWWCRNRATSLRSVIQKEF